MLPDRFATPLQEHLARVKVTHEQDLTQGTADVYIWPALARKYKYHIKTGCQYHLWPA
jgi:hypothetical protein